MAQLRAVCNAGSLAALRRSIIVGTNASIGTYFGDSGSPQEPVAVGVVIPTILRAVLANAIRSVFDQDFPARIQILIGADVTGPYEAALDGLIDERPPNVSVLLLNLPYSTSVRHGGVHVATDGGALRSILSFMANSRYVAYLDDDNTWRPDHLTSLLEAVHGKVWAYSQRMLVSEETGDALGVDVWDSVGVNRGRFAAEGGLVDPSCLIVDKVRAARALGRWAETASGKPGVIADRHFFAALRTAPHGATNKPTVNYSVRKSNVLLRFLREGRKF